MDDLTARLAAAIAAVRSAEQSIHLAQVAHREALLHLREVEDELATRTAGIPEE